jgi:hypothetical protein
MLSPARPPAPPPGSPAHNAHMQILRAQDFTRNSIVCTNLHAFPSMSMKLRNLRYGGRGYLGLL